MTTPQQEPSSSERFDGWFILMASLAPGLYKEMDANTAELMKKTMNLSWDQQERRWSKRYAELEAKLKEVKEAGDALAELPGYITDYPSDMKKVKAWEKATKDL